MAMNIDLAPTRMTQSPWGEAWLLVKITSPRQPKNQPSLPPPPPTFPPPGRSPWRPGLEAASASHHMQGHRRSLDDDQSIELGSLHQRDETPDHGLPGSSGGIIGGTDPDECDSRHDHDHGDDGEPDNHGGAWDRQHVKDAFGNDPTHWDRPHRTGNQGQQCRDRGRGSDGDDGNDGTPIGHGDGHGGPGRRTGDPWTDGGDGDGRGDGPGRSGHRDGGSDPDRTGHRDGGSNPDRSGHRDGGSNPDRSGHRDGGSDPGRRLGDPGRATGPRRKGEPGNPGQGRVPRPRGSPRGGRNPTQKTFKLYCVGCGLHAHNKVSGQARFSLLHGASTLNIGMDGDFDYGMGMGVEAEARKRIANREKKIIPALSLPLTTIKGVITFGPVMTMSMAVQADTLHQGLLGAGVSVKMPAYTASFDFVNPSSSNIKGFRNFAVDRFFTASIAMSHTSSLSMPFDIGVGVVIPMIKLDKRAKIVNRPSLRAHAVMSGDKATGQRQPPGIPITGSSNCDGVTYALEFAHEVDLVMMDRYSKNVLKYKQPIKKGCLKPGSPSKVSAALHGLGNIPLPLVSGGTHGITSMPTNKYRNTGATWGAVSLKTPPAYLDHPKLIVDSTRKLALISALDANIYLLPVEDAMKLPERNASAIFVDLTHAGPRWVNPSVKARYVGNHGRALITDGFDRAFHYFPATLAKYSVSRVRMLGVDEVPRGANQTMLEYGKLGQGGALGFYFVNIDSPFTAIYPVACLVRDASGVTLPKLFAVNDLDRGLKNLTESKDIASAVTGGVVSDCELVHLVELVCDQTGKDPAECIRWRAGSATHGSGS